MDISDAEARLRYLERKLTALERALTSTATTAGKLAQGLDLTQLSGGVSGGGGTGVQWAKSGGSGIPALTGNNPGSATVTLYSFDGTILTAGATDTAFNPSTTAVGANKWLIIGKDVDGFWTVIVESCG